MTRGDYYRNVDAVHSSADPGLYPRDFVGYGPTPPAFLWPGGRRLAVNVVVNYEEGAERSPLDGDLEPEPLVEARYIVPPGERELHMESTYEFGSRVGIWRVLKTLATYEIRPTVFACAVALERNELVAQSLRAEGYDIVGHGYRWIPPLGMSDEVERDLIIRTIKTIKDLTGTQVEGWFYRPPWRAASRSLLAEAGVLYDCGAVNDEIPYFSLVSGRPFLIVPYSLDINDIRFWKGELVTPSQFSEYACGAFDTMHRERFEATRMLSIGLHPRIIGRPGRIEGLARLLEHILSHDDIWIASRGEIARFWLEAFAPADTWNWGQGAGSGKG